MRAHLPSRPLLGAALVLLALLTGAPAFARGLRRPPPPPPPPKIYRVPPRAATAGHPGDIAHWMESHKSLPLPEQQRALQNEPGFRELPPETQQRVLNRLAQLNNMNPEQRTRILDRNEAVERLTPAQRQQYRSAVDQLTALPPARKRLAAKAILDLREMGPEQRDPVIDSPAFRSQFSDGERSMIRTLLTAEPTPP